MLLLWFSFDKAAFLVQEVNFKMFFFFLIIQNLAKNSEDKHHIRFSHTHIRFITVYLRLAMANLYFE